MTLTNFPQVTVLMSVYNGERYLNESIESILNQTCEDFEFIIINDGSTDTTSEILKEYQTRDPRIIIIEHPNMGLTKSLNKGIANARGKYIARQDVDDIALPHRLKKQVDFLESHPDVAVVGAGVFVIESNGRLLESRVYPCGHYELEEQLKNFNNPIPHTTAVLRKDVLNALGGYNERFEKAQDYDLYLRIIERYKIASLAEPLCKLRRHSASISSLDKEGEQLKYGLLALVCSIRRSRGLLDYSNSHEWGFFLQRFEEWFPHSKYVNRFSAKKYWHSALIAFNTRRYLESMRYLIKATIDYPMWFCHKGVGFDIKSMSAFIE